MLGGTPVRIPAWVPRVPRVAAAAWGCLYFVWAFVKLVSSTVPENQCGAPSLSSWLLAALVWEGVVGMGTMNPRSRRFASLLGFATNVGFIAFAFIADARGLEWDGCGCFGGIALSWLPWHALIAAALALPFLAIFLDAERASRTDVQERLGTK